MKSQSTTAIELTSKKLKRQVLYSLGCLLGGAGAAFGFGYSEAPIFLSILGALVAVIGGFWLAVTKFRIWYNHG
jgi:hypothetical protein